MALLALALIVGVLFAVLALVLGGNYAVETLEGDDPDEAWRDTRALGLAILAGAGALVATGVVELAGLVDMFAELLGTSPIAFTNLFSIGLGWLGITDTIELGPGLFLAATLGFLGLSLLATEVKA